MKKLLRKPIPCPECSSHNTVKNGGLNVVCKDCGKHFGSKIRPRKIPTYPDRPPCPECNSYNPVKSSGDSYNCKNCGRKFKREYRMNNEMCTNKNTYLTLSGGVQDV